MRPLRADEIEVRVGSVGQGYMTMLLYKNARVDQAILDEIYGPFNWQRDHKEVKGVVYCGIGIKDTGSGEWIWKWDAGAESFTEKEKGEASDSFKRAGFNWGIGRELYTAPNIRIDVDTVPKKGGYGYELKNKWDNYGWYVSHIEIEQKDGTNVITSLVINRKDKFNDRAVYRWPER